MPPKRKKVQKTKASKRPAASRSSELTWGSPWLDQAEVVGKKSAEQPAHRLVVVGKSVTTEKALKTLRLDAFAWQEERIAASIGKTIRIDTPTGPVWVVSLNTELKKTQEALAAFRIWGCTR